MTLTTTALDERTTTAEDDAACMDLTAARGPVRHIHHQAYACWDSEETRHFYEDILDMPLVATVMIEDRLGDQGSAYCYTFFEIGAGNALAFFEHMSLVHPENFNARCAYHHRHVAFEVEDNASVLQFKRKLDTAGIANTLTDLGTSLSLCFNDPNGLKLEFTSKVCRSLEYEKTSRSTAHLELQRWLLQRQNWWRRQRFRDFDIVSG